MGAGGARIAVWLRDDLRFVDNPALNAALHERRDGAAVIVVRDALTTHGAIPKHPRRLAHEREALAELTRFCNEHGIELVDRQLPDEPSIVQTAIDRRISRIHSLQEWGDRLSFARDHRTQLRLRAAGVAHIDHPHGGIVRGVSQSARGVVPPFYLADPALPGQHVPEIIKLLRAFLIKELPTGRYKQQHWRADIGGEISSRLSVALAAGTVALERVVQETKVQMARAAPYQLSPYNQFLARLSWRHSFIQDFESHWKAFPSLTAAQGHATTAGHGDGTPEYEERFARWRAGQTGIPIVDATMRCLHETGWTTFRLRQTTASFGMDLLGLDWRDVGIALGQLFADYTPGIHWPQITIQAGVAAPERGPRIVNPIKQSVELDPDEVFLRRWLPELEAVPAGFGHEAWRHSAWRGPAPLIDVATAMRSARQKWPARATAHVPAVQPALI